MNILVACEESQAVTIELRKRGHRAFSCDILECSGGHEEWHTQMDVTQLINGNCEFTTMDGAKHYQNGKWDMIIAFPPCTYLTSAGARHFSLKINSKEKVEARMKLREQAYDFFMMFVNADCDKIAIENPVGYMNTHYRKPDQIIHQYYFVNDKNDELNYVQKRTCLWLKGLKPLDGKTFFEKPIPIYRGTTGDQAGRARARSKTFKGIAKAMAEQWA